MAARSAARCPWYCHGKAVYLAFMLCETPSPPHLRQNFPLRNSLMRLSRESISWKGLKANLRSLLIQRSRVFVRLSASPPFHVIQAQMTLGGRFVHPPHRNERSTRRFSQQGGLEKNHSLTF